MMKNLLKYVILLFLIILRMMVVLQYRIASVRFITDGVHNYGINVRPRFFYCKCIKCLSNFLPRLQAISNDVTMPFVDVT